jgi:hypothetical protein
MAEMSFAAVVIEASWEQILFWPVESRLNPKSVFRTAISWQQKFGVPWLAMGSRELAEITTFRLLERFYENETEHLKRTDPNRTRWRTSALHASQHSAGSGSVPCPGPRPTIPGLAAAVGDPAGRVTGGRPSTPATGPDAECPF